MSRPGAAQPGDRRSASSSEEQWRARRGQPAFGLPDGTGKCPTEFLPAEVSVYCNHLPWNCGARFWTKADVPSFLSSVPAARPKYFASSFSPEVRSVSTPLFTASMEYESRLGHLHRSAENGLTARCQVRCRDNLIH